MRKLALKKLKASDLSFFKWHFDKGATAKQKGFNLDTKVLDGQIYPGLKAQLEPREKKAIHVDLTILGPGMSPAFTLSRKIKIDAKNLRLNGEYIHDPDGEVGRFARLKVDDFAFFEFVGDAFPNAVKIVLIAKSDEVDFLLHREFSVLLPKTTDSMCCVTEEILDGVIKAAEPDANHPIRDLVAPELGERIVNGDPRASITLMRARGGRGMTPGELKLNKVAAEKTGEVGEELLDGYFGSLLNLELESYCWVSKENAISPFDFSLKSKDGKEWQVDAKSTAGDFDVPLFLSISEIKYALTSGLDYDIYRLYNVKETGAFLRIARNIGQKLTTLFDVLDSLPVGVKPTSFSIEPNFFDFDEVVVEIKPIDAEDNL